MFFSSQLVEALNADHKKLRTDLIILKETDISENERQICFVHFLPKFISHTQREEKIVYAFMRSLNDENLNFMAYEGKTKHAIAEQIIEEMLSEDLNHQEWSAGAKVLAELVEQHLEEEENEVFPLLKDRLDSDTDAVLRERYDNLNRAPTPTTYTHELQSEAPRWG